MEGLSPEGNQGDFFQHAMRLKKSRSCDDLNRDEEGNRVLLALNRYSGDPCSERVLRALSNKLSGTAEVASYLAV